MHFNARDFKTTDTGKRVIVCNKTYDNIYQGIYHGATMDGVAIIENIVAGGVDLIDFKDDRYTFTFNNDIGIETNFAFWNMVSKKYQFMAINCGWKGTQEVFFCSGNMVYECKKDVWTNIRKEDALHVICISDLLDIIDNPLLASNVTPIKFNYKEVRPEKSCIKRID